MCCVSGLAGPTTNDAGLDPNNFQWKYFLDYSKILCNSNK